MWLLTSLITQFVSSDVIGGTGARRNHEISLSTSMNGLCDEAGLTDNLATPVEPAAAVFDERHLLSPVTAPAAKDLAAVEAHRSRVAPPAAGAQRTDPAIAQTVVGRVLRIDKVLVGVRPVVGRM